MSAFTNKVAVITGGNSGIGLATAKEFSRRGAKVVISGRDERTLAEAATSIGGETLAVRADVSRLADLDKLFARTKERFGPIDVLFVNAGMAKFAPVEQTTEAVYDEDHGRQLQGGVFHGPESPAAAQGRRGGRHQYVRRGGDSRAERQRLCGQQGGAAVVDPDAGGGTARSKNPGERRRPRPDLDARLLRRRQDRPRPRRTWRTAIANQVPMKRLGSPEEIALAVIFLVSDDASYITGVELNVDGGWGQL